MKEAPRTMKKAPITRRVMNVATCHPLRRPHVNEAPCTRVTDPSMDPSPACVIVGLPAYAASHSQKFQSTVGDSGMSETLLT